MRKFTVNILIMSVLILGIAGGTASAAKPVKPGSGSVSAIGNDISWPQCGRALPTGQAFGIVGVNGGLATTTNECLSEQLVWANQSNGSTKQAKIQLYVNTANPGGLNTPSWPSSNTDPNGIVTKNPYGTCDNKDTLACAWQYGWNRAVEDVRDRFVPAAEAIDYATDPAAYPWWLDVETENTWKTGSQFAYDSNVADLEGMVAYFQSVGVNVGIYSTGYQWKQIVSTSVKPGSNLNGLNSWLAGARNVKGAQSNCSLSPLTTGGTVTLTQYVSGSFDYDVSCL